MMLSPVITETRLVSSGFAHVFENRQTSALISFAVGVFIAAPYRAPSRNDELMLFNCAYARAKSMMPNTMRKRNGTTNANSTMTAPNAFSEKPACAPQHVSSYVRMPGTQATTRAPHASATPYGNCREFEPPVAVANTAIDRVEIEVITFSKP